MAPNMELVKSDVTIDSPTEAIVVHDSPLPVFTGEQMAQAFSAYRLLQTALDRSMPEQIMQLEGKPFRKKGYWRAIAVAFKLTVEPTHERREVQGDFEDARPNFGYVVTYRATAPNGRSASGDGSCFAVEKARRFRCPHVKHPNSTYTVHFPAESCPDYDPHYIWRAQPSQATEHNIRSHAHTRAFNRAVSNLVGFGEVSAEEVDREHGHQESVAASVSPVPPAAVPPPADPPAAADVRPSVPNGEDSGRSIPRGYHVIGIYKFNAPWHDFTLLNWDAQGGPLKCSTKLRDIGEKARLAYEAGLPVKVATRMKPNTVGEAYANSVEALSAF